MFSLHFKFGFCGHLKCTDVLGFHSTCNTLPLCIDCEPQQTSQHCSNYHKYPLPHCLHLSTWELAIWIFLDGFITQAVWLHREGTIVVTLISHFLLSNCQTQKGIENQTKVSLSAANKTYPTLAGTTGSLLLLITLWNVHTRMWTQKWMAHQQTRRSHKHTQILTLTSVVCHLVKAQSSHTLAHTQPMAWKPSLNNYPI